MFKIDYARGFLQALDVVVEEEWYPIVHADVLVHAEPVLVFDIRKRHRRLLDGQDFPIL